MKYIKLVFLSLALASCGTIQKGSNQKAIVPDKIAVVEEQNQSATEGVRIVHITPTPTRIEDPYTIFEFINLDGGGELEIVISGECNDTDFEINIRTNPVALTEGVNVGQIFNNLTPFNRKDSVNYSYSPEDPNWDISSYVHSGWYLKSLKNPGENLREFLEGKESYAPLKKVSLQEINEKISCLKEADVTIKQGDVVVNNLNILEVVRISPERIEEFNTTIVPELEPFNYDDKEQLDLIVCGWKLVEEQERIYELQQDGLLEIPNSYTWSRYILVIGK